MRKLLLLLGVVVLLVPVVFLLTKCGNKNGAQTKDNKLVIWGMGFEGEKLKEIVQFFKEENPNVEIEIQAIPWGQAHEKMITAVAGEITPDLCQFGTTWIPEFVTLDALEPLDYLIQNSKEIAKDNYYPGSWKTSEINGVMYGVPWYTDTRVLFYRKDLLKAVGYDNPPKTWDELKDAARKLIVKDKSGQNTRMGISLAMVDWMPLMMFFWSNGGDILAADNKVIINSPENLEALEFYTSFFKEGLASRSGKGGVSMYNEFKEGYTPMFIGGCWMLEEIHKHAPEIDGKWDVAVLPKKKTATSFVGGSNWAIFKNSSRKELAWKFIEFMSKPDTQIKWFQLTKDLPTHVEAWENEYFNDKQMVKVFGKQLADTQSPPRLQKWEEIAGKINQHMEEAIFVKSTSKEALTGMEKDIQEILGKGK